MRRKGISAAVTLALATAAFADEPTSRPAVPALVAGEGSFVAEGRMRQKAGGAGLRAEVVSDVGAERVALVDAADGTPLFLSDGTRTLVYDLSHRRVVLVPSSRGQVTLDVDVAKVRRTQFSFNIRATSDPAGLKDSPSRIDFARFAAAATRLDAAEGGTRYNWSEGGAAITLAVGAGDLSFAAGDASGDEPTVELTATLIGGPVPAERRAFPDVARLRADGVAVSELDLPLLVGPYLSLTAGGRGMGAKLGLALGGGEPLAAAVKGFNGDEAGLRKRDAHFGSAYRAALAKQGIAFAADATTRPAEPTTRPAGG